MLDRSAERILPEFECGLAGGLRIRSYDKMEIPIVRVIRSK